MTSRTAPLFVLALGCVVAGTILVAPACTEGNDPHRRKEGASGAAPAAAPAKTDDAPKPAGGGGPYEKAKGTATLSGVIRFVGTKPEQKPLNKSSEPVCADVVTIIEKFEVNADDTLPHCFVWAVSGESVGRSGYEAPRVEVDQKECVYIPHVFGVMPNQEVLFKNSDEKAHNVHIKPQRMKTWNKQQPPGKQDTWKPDLKEAKPIKVGCDIHSWMGAWIHTVDHPFHATSAQGDGRYRITGLYPGKHTFRVWHENWAKDTPVEFTVELKDGDNTMDVDVAAK